MRRAEEGCEGAKGGREGWERWEAEAGKKEGKESARRKMANACSGCEVSSRRFRSVFRRSFAGERLCPIQKAMSMYIVVENSGG